MFNVSAMLLSALCGAAVLCPRAAQARPQGIDRRSEPRRVAADFACRKLDGRHPRESIRIARKPLLADPRKRVRAYGIKVARPNGKLEPLREAVVLRKDAAEWSAKGLADVHHVKAPPLATDAITVPEAAPGTTMVIYAVPRDTWLYGVGGVTSYATSTTRRTRRVALKADIPATCPGANLAPLAAPGRFHSRSVTLAEMVSLYSGKSACLRKMFPSCPTANP